MTISIEGIQHEVDPRAVRMPTWEEFQRKLPRGVAIAEHREAISTIARIARSNGDTTPVGHLLESLKDIPTTDTLDSRE